MKRRVVTSIFVIVAALTCWMLLGVERFNREHGEADYEFFAKQTPTFKIVFENPAKCGECDLRSWDSMDAPGRSKFGEFCSVRFGLADMKACYAIFEAQQRGASLPGAGR